MRQLDRDPSASLRNSPLSGWHFQSCPGLERIGAAPRLGPSWFMALIGENLIHMAAEETELNELVFELLTRAPRADH